MCLQPFNRTTFGIETFVFFESLLFLSTFNRTTFGIETYWELIPI